jgi:NAD(P)H-hydrate epimerase
VAFNPKSALLNAKQMSEADRLTIAAVISDEDLMENAGRPVA